VEKIEYRQLLYKYAVCGASTQEIREDLRFEHDLDHDEASAVLEEIIHEGKTMTHEAWIELQDDFQEED
jgi:hypothetical protein